MSKRRCCKFTPKLERGFPNLPEAWVPHERAGEPKLELQNSLEEKFYQCSECKTVWSLRFIEAERLWIRVEIPSDVCILLEAPIPVKRGLSLFLYPKYSDYSFVLRRAAHVALETADLPQSDKLSLLSAVSAQSIRSYLCGHDIVELLVKTATEPLRSGQGAIVPLRTLAGVLAILREDALFSPPLQTRGGILRLLRPLLRRRGELVDLPAEEYVELEHWLERCKEEKDPLL